MGQRRRDYLTAREQRNLGREQRNMSLRSVAAGIAACAATGVLYSVTGQRSTGVDPVALLEQLTLDEKLHFFHGVNRVYVGYIDGVDRLGIPPVVMMDGPQGFRQPDQAMSARGSSTAFPCNLAIGATFDRRIAFMYGKFIAKEFRGKGANMLLGPGVNVNRIPRNGRNFEYLSGEDPVLGAEMAPEYVQGAFTENTMTSVKHFIFNNQETERMFYSADVPQQVGMEYYMKPFIAGVQAGAGSVMCSYNRINGTYACENPNTMRRLMKYSDRFFIMSDWGATHATEQSLKAGLTMEMPGIPTEYFSPEKMKALIADGSIPMPVIDDLVLRTLKALKESGQLDGNFPKEGNVYNNVTTPLQKTASTIFAAEGLILLKNDLARSQMNGYPLPLNPVKSAETIATTNCGADLIVLGGGSGAVIPSHTVTIDEVLAHNGLLVGDASKSDAVLYCFSTYSAENGDRADLEVEGPHKELAEKIAESKKAGAKKQKIIVFVSTPGPFLMPMDPADVDAILMGVFPGERAGEAVAAVLYGRMSPNGKLPFALPNKENEQEMTKSQYPGVGAVNHTHAEYTENREFGYRWYQAHNVMPKYHFGHGLSYGINKMLVTNINWAKEKNGVYFCVENQAPVASSMMASATAEVLVETKRSLLQKDTSATPVLRGETNKPELLVETNKPQDGLLSLGSGETAITLLENAVAKLQREIARKGPSALVLTPDMEKHFGLIDLKAAAPAPTKISVQFYVKHSGRPFMELLQFTALENIYPGEKTCGHVVYDLPSYWSLEEQMMKVAPVWDLFVSTNGVSEAQWVGTYNRAQSQMEEPEVVFE
ncbi:unnamed protein product [Amoebophrya sp. A25]|nr:unnamed protein product [Amoebophrya sp. A25]|eukprot:GSA25T00023857001.1